MKTLTKSILFFLLIATPCLAGKRAADDDPDAGKDVVSSVTPGVKSGTATVAITGGTPFAIDSNTTIVIDGAPATLGQIKPGMQVMSQSAPGTTFGEIDLKTLPPDPASKKKKKNSDQ